MIAEQIKQNYNDINEIIKTIKQLLVNLQDKVKEQSMLFVTYKLTQKSYYSRSLSDLLDISPGEANIYTRIIKSASKITKINRVYLELLQIIDKPFRKNTTRKSNPNTLNKAATLIGQLRLLNEQGINSNAKPIIKQLLTQLNNEI